MRELTVSKIIEVTKGKLLTNCEDFIIKDFNKDTRTIQKDDMYIAIKGENFDGNLYIEDALQKGAIGCLIDSKNISDDVIQKFNDKPIIKVDDTIKAIQALAKYKRSLFDIPVVAITGSVGKTSTKDIVAKVLSEKYKVLKTQGNLNNHIGLPLTLLKLREEHTAVVVEMGMNNFGEISVLTNIANPTICAIINIGTSHIGNLGSRENILKAKLEILEGLAINGKVVVNNDNDLLNEWNIKDTKYDKVTYGINNKSDYNADNIICTESYSNFETVVNNNMYNISVPVPGKHFIYNALCAISIARILNIECDDIIKGIQKVELTQKRMEVINNNGITIINDAYNSSYDSVKATLEAMLEFDCKRRIATLGDMLELGSFSKELHEKVGIEVAENNIDILITVGNEAKHIASKAKELGVPEIYICETNLEATNIINSIKKKDDLILLKASNGMHFYEIANNI